MATKKTPVSLAPEVLEALQHIAAGVAEHNQRARRAEADTPETRAELEALRYPLRRIPLMGYVRAIPDLLCAVGAGTKVPDAYLSDGAGGSVEVLCPCDAKPIVVPDAPTFCACGRAYVRVGRDVRVLFSPVKPPGPQGEGDQT